MLEQLTEFCEFGDTLDKMLRDRLVCGINDDRIQQRLLAEPILDFAKALQIALAMESAAKDSKQLKVPAPSGPSQPVYYNKSSSKPRTSHKTVTESSNRSASTSAVVCWRCGGPHYAPSCRYINVVCRACNKKGHLAKVC